MLDVRDWRPDLGEHGKLHIRFGKGARGRGPKARLVPAINGAGELIDWWLAEVRHQFGDDWSDPDAPMLPSERHDPRAGRCRRVGPKHCAKGSRAVGRSLPGWSGRLTPHVLRHYCASSLYAAGMDLKALQELLGHEWLSTTTRYVHVRSDYVERAWARANERVAARFDNGEPARAAPGRRRRWPAQRWHVHDPRRAHPRGAVIDGTAPPSSRKQP